MSDLDKVLARIDADLDQSLERLFAFIRLKSISTDPAFAKDCAACADWFVEHVKDLGFTAEARATGGHPAVVAKSEEGSGPRILFYGHYDVQPVDPLELWQSPPFEPGIGEIGGRKVIRGRGACDDKGQVMTFIEACRAYKAVTGKLPLPMTLLVEGEEESGSKNLFKFVADNAAELKADIAMVCDTGMWDPETPAITSSLRGMVYEEVKVIAADRDLHSGMFGGAAQNPIHVLARIIAALHDENGRVTIPNFYDGVIEPSAEQKADWQGLGLTAENFLGQVGLSVPSGEKDRMVIEQIQSRPTCDANGIWGGYIGEGSKTVIASEASAKISFRLVGNQNPIAIRDAFQAFVRARLPADCKVEFISSKASPAVNLPADSAVLAKARAALTEEWGRKAVTIGSGGSIPIVGDFKKVLGLDSLLVGFGLDDDRVHSPNEKYDLKSFHKGIRSWARILAALSEKAA